MAIKRKFTGRRRAYGAKRRRTSPRKSPAMNGAMCRIKRTFHWQTWTPATTTTGDFWKFLNPRLVDLPSSNELIAVFDQYKIGGVKLTFRPRYTSFDGANTTDTTAPGVTNQGNTHVHYIVDQASNTIPSGTYTSANLNTFLENGSVKSRMGTRAFSIYYRPRTNVATGSGPQKRGGQWNSCTGSSDLAQNGVHVFLQDVNMTGVFGQAFDIFVTFYMAFRGSR